VEIETRPGLCHPARHRYRPRVQPVDLLLQRTTRPGRSPLPTAAGWHARCPGGRLAQETTTACRPGAAGVIMELQKLINRALDLRQQYVKKETQLYGAPATDEEIAQGL